MTGPSGDPAAGEPRRRTRKRQHPERKPRWGPGGRPRDGGAPGPADADRAVPQPPAATAPPTTPAEQAGPAAPPDPARRRQKGKSGERDRDREAARRERGLRNLVGAGSSQVGTSSSMRARDVARPTAEDLAAAEEALTIVRRTGPLQAPTGRQRD